MPNKSCASAQFFMRGSCKIQPLNGLRSQILEGFLGRKSEAALINS